MIVTLNELKKLIKHNYFTGIYKKKKTYISIPTSFDIETTSCYYGKGAHITNEEYFKLTDEKEKYSKRAFMYVWQFAIFNYEIIGRTWEEFIELCQFLKKYFNLDYEHKILFCYVHNLSYEFQFIKDMFNFIDVFALSERKPIKALCDLGIEFRCSYLLSGYSLNVLAKNLTSHNIAKMVGDLDYNKIRHNKTFLSKEEIKYCINDILIVKYYIEECIERFGTIADIPLTQTGIVRDYVRRYTLKDKKYFFQIHDLKLTDDEFRLAKRAFSGGFTHGNIRYINQKVEDVQSFDFTSSYPYVLLSEKYPMSCGVKISNVLSEKCFYNLIENNLALFDVTFYNLKSKYDINTISFHKCNSSSNVCLDNGKIVCADKINISLTNIDFKDIKKFYDYEKCEIFNLHIYKKDYLPKPFFECVLKFYNDKTQLKGVDGKEVEYLHSKEMLNSLYGMCVTNIIRDDVQYVNGKWERVSNDLHEQVTKYNNDKKRFLSYLWGVFVTSYARHNLYTGILEFKDDYVYCDTDSIKCVNAVNHIEYINKYNAECVKKLNESFTHHGIEKTLYKPKTIKGVEKTLGVWDNDGKYKSFKTLGAKRYMYTDEENKLHITIAGLNKNTVNYFLDTYKTIDKVFDNFQLGLYIERGYSGKKTHTYIDEPIENKLLDYNKIKGNYKELSFIHLEDSDFLLNMSDDFLEYIINYSKLVDKTKVI